MPNILYANNAVGTLASAITNAQTTITLNVGQAALFPNPSAPQVFYATLTDAATRTLKEIVQVTAVAGNIFSVVRGQDGTTALSWNQNDFIEQDVIRLELQNFQTASEGVFTGVQIQPSTTQGIAGSVLGDNANAGAVGEYLTVNGNVSLTTTTVQNAALLALTPGDWDVQGSCLLNGVGITLWNATTIALNNVSATIPAGLGQQFSLQSAMNTGTPTEVFSTPTVRFSVSVPITVFLVVIANFTGALAAQGFLRARRVR